MKRVKDAWSEAYPAYGYMTAQLLRDHANRFKKDTAVMSLVLVKQREQLNVNEGIVTSLNVETNESGVLEEENNSIDAEQDPQNCEGNEHFSSERGCQEERDKEAVLLKDEFVACLKELEATTNDKIEERQRLHKVKVDPILLQMANSILKDYLIDANMNQITDAVYAMGRTIESRIGVKRKKKGKRGFCENRRIRKLRKKIKKLRQRVARTANEIHRRRVHRKATEKEKYILDQLKIASKRGLKTVDELRLEKEMWLDQLRGKKVKLRRAVVKDLRIRNNSGLNFSALPSQPVPENPVKT